MKGQEMRYEYGIFNADKEKICAASGGSPDDPSWDWLWKHPFLTFWDEQTAGDWVEAENERRETEGILETYGPVKYRRRSVTFGDWEDV